MHSSFVLLSKHEVNRKWVAALVVSLLLLFAAFYGSRWVSASSVFSDDFSADNFGGWTQTKMSSGASQTVSGGIARFVVPTPAGGSVSYSYLIKDGFTSTVNSTIVASQDILVKQVPNGCIEGNGAIFFLYVCDSADLAGDLGNVGVGIDGSGVWSLWIGGNRTYVYIFQTQGSLPANNTWYHIVLTVDNSAGLVSLSVDGRVVVGATQRQFTDRTHQFSLMSGLGEDWWSGCAGLMEINVDNVRLDVSDADVSATETPTVAPATSNSQGFFTDSPTLAPTHSISPTPSVTAAPPTFSSAPSQSATPTDMQSSEAGFPFWVLVPVLVAVAVCLGVLFVLRKR
jgi:hypothetical protein